MSTGSAARLAAGLLFSLAASLVLAQGYPNRSIRLVVDTSPGGITDLLARLSAEGLAEILSNPKGGYTWIFEQGDLSGRGHFEKGFRHKRPDAT